MYSEQFAVDRSALLCAVCISGCVFYILFIGCVLSCQFYHKSELNWIELWFTCRWVASSTSDVAGGWGFGTGVRGCLRQQVAAYAWSLDNQFPQLWFVLDKGCRQGVAAPASPSSADNDSRVCCVVSSGTRLRADWALGRWTNSAEDSKMLLCHHQWIAVESKDRCFVGKLKFCRTVWEL